MTPWWVMRDLNPRHSPCKGDALPTELITQSVKAAHFTDLMQHVNSISWYDGKSHPSPQAGPDFEGFQSAPDKQNKAVY